MADGSTFRPLTLAVLIPARDEAEALPELLRMLRESEVEGLETVMVVDNGSSDGTADVAREAGVLVAVEPTPGYGIACQRGIAALERADRAPDVLVFLDADDELAAAQIPRLVAPIRGGIADLVVGARQSDGAPGVRAHARFGNRLILGILRGTYGDLTPDMGPFRAIRWSCLRDLALSDPNYGWYVQMQVRALRGGWRVRHVGVGFRRRTRGRSKVSGSIRASVAAGFVMLRTLASELLRSRPDRRPYGRG